MKLCRTNFFPLVVQIFSRRHRMQIRNTVSCTARCLITLPDFLPAPHGNSVTTLTVPPKLHDTECMRNKYSLERNAPLEARNHADMRLNNGVYYILCAISLGTYNLNTRRRTIFIAHLQHILQLKKLTRLEWRTLLMHVCRVESFTDEPNLANPGE